MVVSDPLPVGLIPLSISVDQSNFQCQLLENPVNVVSCVGDIATGDTVTITVHVFITANGGPLYNQACVDHGNVIAETNELDNCQTAITDIVPPAPDLLINKSADCQRRDARPAAEVQHHGLQRRQRRHDGRQSMVTDNLPPQVTLVNATAYQRLHLHRHDDDHLHGRPALASGSRREIEILTTVNADVTTSFANSAAVSVDAAETNTANNGPVTVTTVGRRLRDRPAGHVDRRYARPGQRRRCPAVHDHRPQQRHFHCRHGGDPAQVRIDLPQNGVSFVGADGTNGFNCAQSGSTVTCDGAVPRRRLDRHHRETHRRSPAHRPT